MMLYETVIERLLVESKIDTLARQIVRQIIMACRSEHLTSTGLKAAMDVPWPSYMKRQDGREPTDIKLQLNIQLLKGRSVAVFVTGGWIPSKSILQVDIKLVSPSAELEPEHLSQVQLKCYETVRHELEHSTQPAAYLSNAAASYRAASTGGKAGIWEDPQTVENYFSSPAEIEAFVAGIYHAAKRARMPFRDYANHLINRYKQSAKSAGADPVKTAAVMKKIKKKWFAYAAERFPNAIL